METLTVDRIEDAYRRIHPRLWRALFAYSRDAEVASDAESEAFSQALRRGDAVRDVEAWVWRCAFRVAGGFLQERNRDVSISADDLEVVAESAGRDWAAVEFLSQLGDLSDQQRAIVILRYVGEFDSIEIAKVLRTTPGSVRVQLHRAHNNLRKAMEESDER